LVLCTGNSARSVLAEALINHLAAGAWRAYSAGSQPTGRVNPLALSTLARHGIQATNARSKSWDEFALHNSPKMDLIVTVCDNAANEICPVWPGAPRNAHWGLEDPASVNGQTERAAAFELAYQIIRARVLAFVSLDFDASPATQIDTQLQTIGKLNAL
jgi:arsenate reductase (thioredoxin)